MFCPYCGDDAGDSATCRKSSCVAAHEDALDNLSAASNRATVTVANVAALLSIRSLIWSTLDGGTDNYESIAERVKKHGGSGETQLLSPLVDEGGPKEELEAISDAVDTEITHLEKLATEIARHERAIKDDEELRARRAKRRRLIITWVIVILLVVVIAVVNQAGS